MQESIIEAWKNHDYDKLLFLKDKIRSGCNLCYCVDVSLEEGDETMVKFLLEIFPDAKPSLYAKQMALINGHISLVHFVDTFFPVRNTISIAHVHCRKGVWDHIIPPEHRYIFNKT